MKGSSGLRKSREMVKVLMKLKLRDTEEEREGARRKDSQVEAYLKNRWGHHTAALSGFYSIQQAEVRRVWEERRSKHTEKVNHLERKWRKGGGTRGQRGREDTTLLGIRYSITGTAS